MTIGSDVRVLFIGGTPRGLAVFERLIERGVTPVAMYCLKEDDHEHSTASLGLLDAAEKHDVPAKRMRKLSADDVSDIIETHRPDLILVVGWRTLIPAELYTLPVLGCVGVHDSPLPRYRGFAPVNWAIINGERQWGVSLFHLADGVDEGDIVGQVHFDVARRATAPELYEQVIDATLQVVDDNLEALMSGTASRTRQDQTSATFACARTPQDGEIDWTTSTETIDRLIRGLTFPYPGAWTAWKGERLVVWEAEPLDPAPVYEGRIPARVVAFTDSYADVLTVDGVLRLHKVQLAGGDLVPAGQVIRSLKASLGS